MNPPLLASMPWVAAVPPTGSDSVGVFVEIVPLDTSCAADCVAVVPPPLPPTGAEAISLLLPVALVVAGVVATLWSRRDLERPRGGRSLRTR